MKSIISGCLGLAIKVAVLLLFTGCLVWSCGNGGSGASNNGGAGGTFTAPLDDDFKNFPLNEGENQEFVFTYTLSNDLSEKARLRLNLSETLANTYLSAGPTASAPGKFEEIKMLAYLLIKDAFADESAHVRTHISYAGDPDVCDSPFVYGPYTIGGTVGSALNSSTASVSADQASRNIINAGSFEMCVKATPPIDAFLTVSGVVVDYDDCEPSELNIVGEWAGYYECTDFDEAPDMQTIPISMTITKNQDGSYRYVDDTKSAYEGHLCENKFRYKGGEEGISRESGTMVFKNSMSATKTSIYNSLTQSIRLRCSDTLHKVTGSSSQ